MHAGFLDALAALSPADQRRVRASVGQLAAGYSAAGLRRHNVGQFVSLSSSMDLRILAAEDAAGLVLVYVDHHDAAYRWATRHRSVESEDQRVLAVVPLGVDSDTARPIGSAPGGVTADPPSGRYSALPVPIARMLDQAGDDSELLDLISALSPEWQEVALFAAGSEPRRAMPSDIIAVDDSVLEFALSLPEERWRVFLHPKQRLVVDRPFDGPHLLLRGGPGTGKTVSIVHRFLRAKRDNAQPPMLMTVTQVTRSALLAAIRSLDPSASHPVVMTTADLPRTEAELAESLGKYSTVLVDEGQDMPIAFIARLAEMLDRGLTIPQVTLAFDANQAIISPAGDALARLSQHCDTTTLTYCYRSTYEIAGYARALVGRLHGDYVGRSFQHEHHVAAQRDSTTATLTTALTGPEVRVLTVNPVDVVRVAIEEGRDMQQRTSCPPVFVIVPPRPVPPGDPRDAILSALPSAVVLTPDTVKGMEFFRGIVVDLLEHGSGHSPTEVTRARYTSLSGLYVAATRFRDELVAVGPSESPLVRALLP